MKTDELIALLGAAGATADAQTERRAARRAFSMRLAAGFVISFVAMLVLLGPRPDWNDAIAEPMFWIKLAFPAIVALAALSALRRLGYPGAPVGAGVALALGLPVAAVWFLAGQSLLAAEPASRLSLVMGNSWWQCVVSIVLLAAPTFLLACWALRALAPTRLTLTGAVAGAFAGGVGALAYALHCPEMEAAFLAVWYVLGMLLPAGFGAMVGWRLLRW